MRNEKKVFYLNLVLVVGLSLVSLVFIPNFHSVVRRAEQDVSLSSIITTTVPSISVKADATEETTFERDQDEREAEELLLNSQCKQVEHLCYSTGRWWFKSISNLTAASPPNLVIQIHNGKVAFPRTIEIGGETPELSGMNCPYSPIANHVSVAAKYNHMLGEFYRRDLLGLASMLENSTLLSNAQVYLHLWNLDRSLLDSQRAFLAPFVRHPVLEFRELLQSSGCSCLERLYLCGYRFKDPPHPQNEKNDTQSDIFFQNKTIVTIGGAIKLSQAQVSAAVPQLYHRLQSKVIQQNPFIKHDITAFRQKVLQSRGIQSNLDDWKLVGLTQRTGRRRWINLDASLEECNKKFKGDQIVCVEVNVENEEFHPTHHPVVHASLDGLIGIHGAQLTDAIWMKPGSLVVEILPFVPNGARMGTWTRKVTGPTPLGVIYSGTDLYHVGLPLTFSSVPQCTDTNGTGALKCIKNNPWDSRDFLVEETLVVDVIAGFINKESFRPRSCTEQRARGEKHLVSYNVQCQ